jgi:molybdopterin converting factor subunit 1
MTIAVKLFAAARELACAGEVALELGPAATVGDARHALIEQCPMLGPLADRSLLAVNAEYADDERLLAAGDEVALIPPVSGG